MSGPCGGLEEKGAAGRGQQDRDPASRTPEGEGKPGPLPHPRLLGGEGGWEGRDGEEGQGGQPPGAGRPGGRVPSACQVPAVAWEAPSPEILIQPRHRTGFSTGSAKGDGDRKKPRGQEGSRPAGAGRAPRGTPGTRWHHSLSRLWGGLPGVGADPACYTDALPHTLEAPQGPTVLPAPHLSQVRLAQPGEMPGWTRSSPPLLPPHNTPRLLRSRGEGQGSQQAWGGARGRASEPAPFHPPPQRAWPPQSHPSCACGSPLSGPRVRGPGQRAPLL